MVHGIIIRNLIFRVKSLNFILELRSQGAQFQNKISYKSVEWRKRVFENLSDRLNATFTRLGSKGRLDEADIDDAMKEVRRALLEADVNFKVVKSFVERVRERAVGQEVLRSLTPAQQVVAIVHEQLIELLGEPSRLEMSKTPPTVVMLVGLQGSGKTTTAAKLGLQLRRAGQTPMLVAADAYR